MIGKWLLRLGSGVLVAIIEAVRATLAGQSLDEFGVYAGVAGGAVSVIVTVLGSLGRLAQDKLGSTPDP